MPGDPKECRLRARQCLQLAKRAATEKERQIFLRLERSWNRLAAEIEDAQAFVATLKATERDDLELALSSLRGRPQK
jgi:uncharacterized protein YlxW (UPF0749 family)